MKSPIDSYARLDLALIFFLVGCATTQTIDQPTVPFLTPTSLPPTVVPAATVSIPSPMPSPSPSQPPNSYPPPMNELPPPQTIVERAVRHLAGWTHTPVEEIRVVSVGSTDQRPSLSDSSCSSRWEFLDDGAPTDSKQGKLVTLQARGKNYRYYAVGDALLLCPIQLP